MDANHHPTPNPSLPLAAIPPQAPPQPPTDYQHQHHPQLLSDETYPFVVVRALYPYLSSDPTTISLTFEKDDLIQVVAQLQSGWWYGFCNDARGWFPSNFVEEITQEDLDNDERDSDHAQDSDSDSQDEDTGNDDLWLPQTTSDGQVYYFNTRTGDSSWSIPTPSSTRAESARRSSNHADRNNTNTNTHPAFLSTSSASASASPSAATTSTPAGNNPAATTSSFFSALPSQPPKHHRSDSANTDGPPPSASSVLDPVTNGQRNGTAAISRQNGASSSSMPSQREPYSPGSSRSSLTGGGGARDAQEHQDHMNRVLGASGQEQTETDSRGGSSRPNSWQTSAVPTRAGSPMSQDGFGSSLGGIRKPSGAQTCILVEQAQLQGLPPMPPVSNPFESGPTWNSLAEHTSGTLQNLIQSAASGYKAYYQIQAAQVVESVRVMLYASGTIDKDAAPIRLHRGLKVHHRQIMAALSRLVLSAKMASSVWPAEGAITKMRSDADDVANAVHHFITTAQSVGVTVHDVDAKLILDPEGPFESRSAKKLSRTLSNGGSRPSFDGVDKTSYRRSMGSAGLLTQLDYYCKSACKAIGLLALQISKVLEGSQAGAAALQTNQQGSSRPLSGSSIMNSAQSSQLVAQCQQTLSQIGSLLALVSEYYAKVLADHPNIKDHIFLDVRVSKQALYNNVAALVMAIQLATDPMAQSTVLEMTLEAIQTAEQSVADLTAAARSLAAENDEAEKPRRTRVTSETTSMSLVSQTSNASMRRQSEIDEYFLDQDSDLDGETAKSSRQRSDSRPSSLSSSSSFSGLSAPTTPGTEYTSRTQPTVYPYTQPTPISPMEITPPASRPSISLSQKADARGAKLKKMLGEDAPTPKPAKVVEVPWFLGHDYAPADISFNMEGHVKGGTLPALVERLTLHDVYDANFVATFLLTYRSFTSTSEFFSLLFQRIKISPPPGLDTAELTKWTDRKLTPIRLRVFNIIKSWLEHFYLEDEGEDRQMLPKIKEFAESGLMRESMSFAAVQLIKLVEKRETSDGSFRRMILNLSTQAPQPITPRNLKRIRFMDLDPLEFARQLTIMEANAYNRIKPIECLANAWTSSDPETAAKAINIRKMIETSNLYANWINQTILSEKDVKKRATILRHVITVAEKLRQLNNFSMLYTTTAALAQSPIHRLRRTWEQIPHRTMNVFATLQTVTSSAKNWGDYRQELHSANPPCVPFVGVYLTDLVMIQDGNPDILKGTEQHINFYKRVSTAEVIREIQQYQSVPYCLTTVHEIQAYIRRGLDHSKSVMELHQISLQLEPREGEEEKITRLLSESGFL